MSEDQYRLRALEWLSEHAPATIGSPAFERVTQGRYAMQERVRRNQIAQGLKPSVPYSSCGDLAHAMLWALGVRSWWVNRAAAGRTWRIGQNVTLLCAMPAGRNPIATGIYARQAWPQLHPGDVIVVNAYEPATTHVSVVISQGAPQHPEQCDLKTADYGQPHGRVIDMPLWREPRSGVIMRGKRVLNSILNLGNVLVEAEARGELVTDAP